MEVLINHIQNITKHSPQEKSSNVYKYNYLNMKSTRNA